LVHKALTIAAKVCGELPPVSIPTCGDVGLSSA